MPALTNRDLAFLAWNLAVGLAAGVAVVARPEFASAALPPLLWLLLAMAAYEIAAGAVLGLQPGSLVSTPVRFLGLLAAVVLYLLVPVIAGA